MANILARFFLRRDAAATWGSANPTLSAGEPGFESDVGRLRIGTGAAAFNSLRAFLSVPTGAITAAQALLNATSAAAQRTALGITGGISNINSLGSTAIVVTDWNDVHALGSGLYQGNAVATNRPENASHIGHYVKHGTANGILRIYSVSEFVFHNWQRRYVNGVWEVWTPLAAASHPVSDWDDAVYDGNYWSSNVALNAPVAAYHRGWVATENGNTDVVSQIISTSGSDRLWYRRRLTGVWAPWVEITHSGNVLSMMKANLALVPYISSEQTITPAGLLTLAHGLGAVPSDVRLKLICKTAEANYAVNDEIWVDLNQSGGGATNIHAVYANTTNVFVRYGSGATSFIYGNKNTGVPTSLVSANWKLIVRAYP